MQSFDIPDWCSAYKNLLTARLFGDETLILPVAGKRTDGAPDYSRLFARDLLLSCFAFEDAGVLWCQDFLQTLLPDTLRYLAAHQGRKPDPFTNEEPGKILHELEGIPLRRHNTLFSACDTTILFLLGCARYAHGPIFRDAVWQYLVPRMLDALVYVRAHIENGIFWERPDYAKEARDFALWAPYWRDYGLPGRRGRKLAYPATFLLVQAQLCAALRALIVLTREKIFPEELEHLEGELALASKAFLKYFGESAAPPVAIDQKGPIHFTCTDAAHALYYLEPGDVSYPYLCGAKDALLELQTPWGWLTWKCPPKFPASRWEPPRIWPWEHVFIAEGLAKHGLSVEPDLPFRPARFLSQTHAPLAEFIEVKRKKPSCAGCHIQQWTCAYWAWIEKNAAKIKEP